MPLEMRSKIFALLSFFAVFACFIFGFSKCSGIKNFPIAWHLLCRPHVRRKSAKFKSEKLELSEDLLEARDAKSSTCLLIDDVKVQENGSTSTCSLKNEKTEGNPAPAEDLLTEQP